MRNTKQRDEILKSVMNSHDHPCAETIYLRVKETLPNISLGTVYRNLCQLSEQKQINRISVAGAADRFDKTLCTHSHFHCKSCGAVCDIEADSAIKLCDEMSKHSENQIDEIELMFYGTCKACKDKLKG